MGNSGWDVFWNVEEQVSAHGHVEQLQAAIEAGVDPTLEGEATAAGPGAGGAGGAGGGRGSHGYGGGGGAGGYRNSYNSETSGGGGSSETAFSLRANVQYTITVLLESKI